jgi:hypothetical protein
MNGYALARHQGDAYEWRGARVAIKASGAVSQPSTSGRSSTPVAKVAGELGVTSTEVAVRGSWEAKGLARR